MKKLLLGLTLIGTMSANASCLGFYENIVVKHNGKANKNILSIMGDDYKDMGKFIYKSEHSDAYSKLVAPIAAVIVSPIVLFKGLSYKSDYSFYERLVISLTDPENDEAVSRLKRSIARRYNISDVEFLDVLNELNIDGKLCEGNERNLVLSDMGMEYIQSRGYTSFLQVALSANKDPETFSEINANPNYTTLVRGTHLDVSEIKDIMRDEIKSRGYERIKNTRY